MRRFIFNSGLETEAWLRKAVNENDYQRYYLHRWTIVNDIQQKLPESNKVLTVVQISDWREPHCLKAGLIGDECEQSIEQLERLIIHPLMMDHHTNTSILDGLT